jgi:hypothetical protein
MLERSNQLINEISQISFGNLPVDDWNTFFIDVCALNKMISVKASYDKDGVIHSFDPESDGQDISLKFKELRTIHYNTTPNKGAWYSVKLIVDKTGKVKMTFDYDNKPAFKYEPSKDKFIDDLKVFQREDRLVPAWLRDIIN